MTLCTLCTAQTDSFTTWKGRVYVRCASCDLIQLVEGQHPTVDEERSEYRAHNNDPTDLGYRKFLSRVTKPVLECLNQEHLLKPQLLDFGCGPGPTISVVLGESGWQMHNYDPLFYPNDALLKHRYDLITCTEVVEHFHHPRASWTQLLDLLKSTGKLFVMTQVSDLYQQPTAFVNWHYIREKSHVAFYHTRTMAWIAQWQGVEVSQLERNVFVFKKVSEQV